MKSRLFFSVLLFGVTLLPIPAHSAGIPVIDATNLTQATVSALESVNQTVKQIEQYMLQLQQYEDQIRNAVAPAAYVWSQAQKTMNKVLALQNQLESYTKLAGNLDAYLLKFGNPNFYRSSPYFSAPSSDPATREKQLQEVMQAEEWGMEAQKESNDNVVRTLQQQQEALALDASTLEQLQSSAQSALGRMQAIQYTNQFLAQQNSQLLQLRGALMAKMAAESAREQTIAAREARERAANEKLFESRYEESPKVGWTPF